MDFLFNYEPDKNKEPVKVKAPIKKKKKQNRLKRMINDKRSMVLGGIILGEIISKPKSMR